VHIRDIGSNAGYREPDSGNANDHSRRTYNLLFGRVGRTDFFGNGRQYLVERRNDAIHYGHNLGNLYGHDDQRRLFGYVHRNGRNGEHNAGNAYGHGRRIHNFLLGRFGNTDIFFSNRQHLVNGSHDAVYYGNCLRFLHGSGHERQLYFLIVCSNTRNRYPASYNTDDLRWRTNDILFRRIRCTDVVFFHE
jgi:hypothetical protein